MTFLSRMLTKLDIHPEEQKAFGWAGGLMFLILSSEMLFGNFADTAFIKRFGVEYLPEMFVVDAVLVFLTMDILRRAVGRYRPTSLLIGIFTLFALIQFLFRLLVNFDISALYPVMYISRQQVKALMLIVAWNLCNDLFDTRQAKRLFPLITAAGILGRIVGSLSTNLFGQAVGLDNLILVSAGLLLLGALVARRTEIAFSSALRLPKQETSPREGGFSPIAGVKEMTLLARGSVLFLLLAAIRILPNMVGPIFDFQFSVILDQTMATEQGLIEFYGAFRGVLNIVILFVLMFSGKIYARVGLPNALLFRPGNYFLVFALLLFRFDILIGIYARLSISVFTMAMHNPARQAMINLFPQDFRAKIRPLLQVAATAGSLVGSGMLVTFKSLVHVSWLSIPGLVFVGGWVGVTFVLKRRYPAFLVENLLRGQADFEPPEEIDLTPVVKEKQSLDRLLTGLREGQGRVATLCGRLLARAHYPRFGRAVVSALPGKKLATQIDLLDLLTRDDASLAGSELREMTSRESPELRSHLIRTLGRLAPEDHADLFKEALRDLDPNIQAEAVVGLYRAGLSLEAYPTILSWLQSPDPEDRMRALTTGARAGEPRLASHIDRILASEKEAPLRAKAVEALGLLDTPERNRQIVGWLDDPDPGVRKAALSSLVLEDSNALRKATSMLADESADVREKALARITEFGKQAVPFLLKALNTSNRDLKDGILRVLETLEVKHVELSRFVTQEIRSAFEDLHAIRVLKTMDTTPGLRLLIRHLEDRKSNALRSVFRLLELGGEKSSMRVIHRGLKGTGREKANAVEALESTLSSSLSRRLIPLVDDTAPEKNVKTAQKDLGIHSERFSDPMILISFFLQSDDPVAKLCAVYVVEEGGISGFWNHVRDLEGHPDRQIQVAAKQARAVIEGRSLGEDSLSPGSRMIHLEEVTFFAGLTVGELATVASLTVVETHGEGEIVMKEGEAGHNFFVIVSGEVSVIRNHGDGERVVTRLGKGKCFGEMALLDDRPQSTTIRAETDSRFLVLDQKTFHDLMRDFPQIPINMCRLFSERLRELQERFLLKTPEEQAQPN